MPPLANVTLEMSLKPFRDLRDDAVRAVCRTLFRQWARLTALAERVSVLLWTADGSEILDYAGRLDDPIEWARYIGHPNPREPVKGDPEKQALHSRARLYMDDPPKHTYRTLAAIVRTIRDVGRQELGKPIRVGATFDPGGEFARSPFKYERHNEICLGGTMGRGSFVCCYGVLHGDTRAYAGFPKGIPDGTPLGTFLGRQARHFLHDLGFDYLWFSNGFGFGLETWKTTGPLFDGKTFHPERAAEVRTKIVDFWKRFRAECPTVPIETRGTNLVAGSDLASNGTPLRDLYGGGFGMTPPPNSPWAALNGDFGLELVGYLSRIAELPPDTGFPFRFYIHDPWWLNSPWLDRYGRQPHDIYLPLAVARLDAGGRVETARSVALLTVDDSYGRMPDQVPDEVSPHLLAALRTRPDAPGPLVWVYPLAEYEAMAFGKPGRLAEPFFGDWFVRAAVNNGLPLNTVIASTSFVRCATDDPGRLTASVLLAPVPDGDTPLAGALLAHAEKGGALLLYGPLGRAGKRLLAALNLKTADPLDGELRLTVDGDFDELRDRPYPRRVLHRALMSAGGCEAELADDADPFTHVVARVGKGDESRVAALWRPVRGWDSGVVGWVRGTHAASYRGGHLLTADDPATYFPGELLLRRLLAATGWRVRFARRDARQPAPVLTISRHANGWYFAGCTPSTTVELRLRTPAGAPLFVGVETELRDGAACHRLPRAWRHECRAFVEQETGEVSCDEQFSGHVGVRRRLRLTGLHDATVRFFPEPDAFERTTFLLHPAAPYLTGNFLKPVRHRDLRGDYLQVGPVSGPLLVSW
ncbi:MAG: hypothetical protein U0736_02990 [Gemmataceae bacterium]